MTKLSAMHETRVSTLSTEWGLNNRVSFFLLKNVSEYSLTLNKSNGQRKGK